MLISTNCDPTKRPSIWRDVAIATIPTLVAIMVQKGLDEIGQHFARKREAAADERAEKNGVAAPAHPPDTKTGDQ